MYSKWEWKKPLFVSCAEESSLRVLDRIEQLYGSPLDEHERLPHHIIARNIRHWGKCTFRYPCGITMRIYTMWDDGTCEDDVPGQDEVDIVDESLCGGNWRTYFVDVLYWPNRTCRDGEKARLTFRGKALSEMLNTDYLAVPADDVGEDVDDDESLRCLAATLAFIRGGAKDLQGVTEEDLWRVVSQAWYFNQV